MPRRGLICGISGQDGAYLAQYLLAGGYEVAGTSRAATPAGNLLRLDINSVQLHTMAIEDFESVVGMIERCQPTEIYNLAGQSSVGLSFEQPAETIRSIANGTLNILEAIRQVDPAVRLFNAGSGECFGDTGGVPATEATPLQPRSPYAVAKAAAYWMVANYREAYGLYACTGILFNHESPLRPARFVTQKIVQAACRIAAGSGERLQLGNIEIQRDWGWAPEYVDAMQRMLQQDVPQDLILATGESQPLATFIDAAFAQVGLRWQEHVDSDPALLRPTDVAIARADPSRAAAVLGWRAETRAAEVARRMVEAELARTGHPPA